MNGEALHEDMLQEDRQHLFHVVETPLVTLAEIRGAKVVPASVSRPTRPQHRLLAVTGTGREKISCPTMEVFLRTGREIEEVGISSMFS